MTARDCKWLVLCFAMACRFGGPTGNPAQLVDLGHDGGSGGSGGGRGGAGGRGGGDGASPETAPPVRSADAAEPNDAGTGAPNDAAPGELRPDASADSGSACAPTSSPFAACDPVHDTGCDPGLQCDVDFAQPMASLCAFSTPYDAGPCVTTPLSESCPERNTCLDGICRSLCFCDADCAAGECCLEPLDTLGWMLCAPCP